MLGRVYTIHPMNFECFCLRLLLHVVPGPTSFEDVRTVDGHVCATFKEACAERGLLEDDQHWDKALEEASVSHSAWMVRQLFAIMLVYCNLAKAALLWEKHRDSMSEDVLHQARLQADNQDVPFFEIIYNQALILIEDKVLEIGGQTLDSYAMTPPDRNRQGHVNRHMLRETSYDPQQLEQYIAEHEPSLTSDQAAAYHKVLDRVTSGKE
jgi:hypothetical protein